MPTRLRLLFPAEPNERAILGPHGLRPQGHNWQAEPYVRGRKADWKEPLSLNNGSNCTPPTRASTSSCECRWLVWRGRDYLYHRYQKEQDLGSWGPTPRFRSQAPQSSPGIIDPSNQLAVEGLPP